MKKATTRRKHIICYSCVEKYEKKRHGHQTKKNDEENIAVVVLTA